METNVCVCLCVQYVTAHVLPGMSLVGVHILVWLSATLALSLTLHSQYTEALSLFVCQYVLSLPPKLSPRNAYTATQPHSVSITDVIGRGHSGPFGRVILDMKDLVISEVAKTTARPSKAWGHGLEKRILTNTCGIDFCFLAMQQKDLLTKLIPLW